tara:strand:+ start:1662 stop:2441 length:780 start_codon:yes stop_codon:yes gene_type:complete
MATFIDQRDDELEGEEISSLEPSSEPEVQATTEEEIPEKYRGKDLKDIVQMHQEAEKLLGRQSQEVGELRQTFDQYIKTQLDQENQAHTSAAEPEVDFFEDPKAAVENAIANHPKIKEAETATQRLRMQEAVARLKTEHADFAEILKDEEFGKWVTKSKFRAELLQKADREYNFDAADELLTSWKERQTVVEQAKQNETTSRKQSVKAASTGNTRGSGEAPSRKVYRRADIIKLMQTDPDRYMSLAEEIRHAYAEGRVR